MGNNAIDSIVSPTPFSRQTLTADDLKAIVIELRDKNPPQVQWFSPPVATQAAIFAIGIIAAAAVLRTEVKHLRLAVNDMKSAIMQSFTRQYRSDRRLARLEGRLSVNRDTEKP